MAKISANGAKEICRYKLGDGAAYVVCSDGRVLYRFRAGNFMLVRRFESVESAKQAAEAAARRHLEEIRQRDPWLLE